MQNTPLRHLTVRPNLTQLKRQAKDLLKAVRAGEPDALAEYGASHPHPETAAHARLADAQLALARSYGLTGWPRLVEACQMTHAIWTNDIETVRRLVIQNPKLLVEDARGIGGNWGPPLSYAANLGRIEMIQMLRSFGAEDIHHGFARACLQGQLETARLLFDMGARPRPGAIMDPCETLNPEGLKFLLDLGVPLADEHDDKKAPTGMLLETYCRGAEAKHRCMEIVRSRGVDLLDTPPMALHCGRLDLLERHLKEDPNLFTRTFSHREIFPLELGCHEDETLALHGTPLAGATLLHMCVDYDEFEIAHWILERGGPVDAIAAVDEDGFGGHTALFGCVVSQAYMAARTDKERFTKLLLKYGANVNATASLRKALRFVEDESLHEYRDITPLSWGQKFHHRDWVNRGAMRLIEEAGGEP